MKTLLAMIVVSGPLFPLLVYFILAITATFFASRKGRQRGKKHWGRNTALIFALIMFWDLPIVWGTHSYQCANNAGFTLNKTLEQWKTENPGVAETLVAREYPINIESLPPPKYRYKTELVYATRENGAYYQYYRYPSGIELRAKYTGKPFFATKEFPGDKLDTVSLFLPNVETKYTAYLNQRFGWIIKSTEWPTVQIEEKVEAIIDLETGEVLARYTDFSRGPKYGVIGGSGWQPWNIQQLKFWLGVRSCPKGKYPDPKWTVDGDSFGGWESKFKNINGEKG